MSSVAAGYLPILLFLAVALILSSAFVFLPMIVARLTGAHNPTPEKLAPYECGMPPVGEAYERMSVKFYLVAMLFILFDIEVVFLYPWAVVYKQMLATNATLIFGSMVSFLGVLFIGYVYAVKKHALDWKN